eukprot:TRINITY_DN355_c2_g1_i1.p2 TRINITY_DN355_c2_g1~~TRINITY_DN355_c2_g1_i1.p2  ORF type:complete len:674 (+),score=217.55 TRINITY_DN355_c2_g1_i1:83-2104(+)
MAAEAAIPFEAYQRFRQLFGAVDADSDSHLSRREVLEKEAELRQLLPALSRQHVDAAELFRRLDKDRDGYVSAAELLRIAAPDCSCQELEQALQSYQREAARRALLSASDACTAGADGGAPAPAPAAPEGAEPALTAEAYFTLRDTFALLDADGSGLVSLAELRHDWARELVAALHDQLWSGEHRKVHSSDDAHRFFKRADKDHSGTVSPAEFCRYFFPSLPPHSLRQLTATYEEQWRKAHPDGGAAKRQEYREQLAADEEAEQQAAREVRISAAHRRVIDCDEYLFYKELFESIDSSGDGRVSSSELRWWTSQHGTPFTANMDWQAIDRDRNGYVTFDELLRAAYPGVPPWRLERDCIHWAAQYGMPTGVSRWPTRRCGERKSPRRPATAPRQGAAGAVMPRRSTPTESVEGSLQPLPFVFPSERPPTRTRFHMQRAGCAELCVAEMDARDEVLAREAKERGRLRVAYVSCGRRQAVLSRGEENALTERLYTHWLDRAEERQMKREMELSQEPRLPGNKRLRWLNHTKLSDDALADTNHRLYQEQVDLAAQRASAREEQRLEALTAPSRHQTPLEPHQTEAMVQRLGVADLGKRREHFDLLVARHGGEQPPPKRKLGRAQVAANAARLYKQAVEHRNETLSKMREKFTFQPPRQRLTWDQQARMVERIAQRV